MRQSILCAGAFAVLIGCSAGADLPAEGSAETQSSALLVNNQYAIDWDLGDNPTQCVYNGLSMHCCPSSYAMSGTLIPGNSFRCLKLANNSGSRFLDTGTQRMGMHACPSGSVMVGLHEDANWLVCQWLPGIQVREDLDVGTPGAWHNCHLPGMESGLMSGIRIDQATYLCAADLNMGSGGGGPTTSTVTATIDVDVGSAAPQQGCGSTSFVWRSCSSGTCDSSSTPMTFLGSQLLVGSPYRCRYSGQIANRPLTPQRIDVSDFNSCRRFTPAAGTYSTTLSPFTCSP